MKSPLRIAIRQKRSALSPVFCAQASRVISEKIIAEPIFKKSQHIALYCAHENEVDVRTVMMEAWAQSKIVYLPRWDHHQLTFHAVSQDDALQKNKFGIAEPASEIPKVDPTVLELMILPMVAFDVACHRLGRGGGAYDRYLASIRPYLIGAAYEMQRTDVVPTATWDVIMDLIVTESTSYDHLK